MHNEKNIVQNLKLKRDIKKIASSSIRLDVSSYGTGNNNINWVAGR